MNELSEIMLMNGPIVSVVIPTIGRVEEVRRCVSSVLKQSLLPNEIIVIDSVKDSGIETLLTERNQSQKVRIIFIYLSSHSANKKRNIGVKNSRGDIIFLFDDDVVLDKDYLKEVMKIFNKDSLGTIGGVTGNISNYSKRDKVSIWNLLTQLFFLGRFGEGDFLLSGCPTFVFGLNNVTETRFLSAGTSAYRRRVFEGFKFDEQFGKITGYCFMDDVDFSLRASKKFKFIYTPYASLRHYPSWTRKAEYDPYLIMQQQVVNHFYLFKKNIPRHIQNMVAFCFSIFGRLVLSVIFERKPRKIMGWFKGVIKGIKSFS